MNTPLPSGLSGISRSFWYFIYRMIFLVTPDCYRPYSLFFPSLRSFLAKRFLTECGKNIVVKYGADISMFIKIGSNSEFGRKCEIYSDVEIGKDIIMGPEVKIFSRNHRFDRIDIPMRLQGPAKYTTIIGNDVWLGARSMIMPGVTIGNHVVVAAGSVVTKNVPDGAVIGGVPARIIRFRTSSFKNKAERLISKGINND